MRQARRLAVVLLVTVALAWLADGYCRPFLVWFALVLCGVLGGLLLRRPLWMGKRADGTFPAWSYAVWLPWHAITRLLAVLHRRAQPPAAHEVAPRLYVGGWPQPGDVPSDVAIVDLTCELPRRVDTPAYFCAPTWDHTAPTVDDIGRAVQFAVEQRKAGRSVLVHCAHGRGRSALVACGVLIAEGALPDADAAIASIRRTRAIRLNGEQRAALEAWLKTRVPR